MLLLLVSLLVTSCDEDDCLTCTDEETGRVSEICKEDNLRITDPYGQEVMTWYTYKEFMLSSGNCK